ncbi:MAG: M20 family metallo-hydrolase [bacterium]
MKVAQLRVNGKRLRESMETMARIGGTKGGGMYRLALSKEDREARDLLISWLGELNLKVTVDQMGNIFARRSAIREELPAVLMGSHLDTQPFGGRFDGVLGVMGALEVMRTLQDRSIQTTRALVLCDWTNEEGSRFSPGVMGSGVWAGKLQLEEIHKRQDLQGRSVKEELRRIGYLGQSPCRAFPVHAYYELHVEQGPVLDKMGIPIGVPRGVVCIHWYEVLVQGESNQVGPTPMEARHDALCAASEMILHVESVAKAAGAGLVATVGRIQNHPDSPNIIPGRVLFTVDIRSWDEELALRSWQEMEKGFREMAARRGCSIEIQTLWRVDHVEFDPKLLHRVREKARALGYETLDMQSAAGHDASYLAMVAPTAMIFVPSIGGRSHVELEETSWEHCEAGANVLLQCALASAQEED